MKKFWTDNFSDVIKSLKKFDDYKYFDPSTFPKMLDDPRGFGKGVNYLMIKNDEDHVLGALAVGEKNDKIFIYEAGTALETIDGKPTNRPFECKGIGKQLVLEMTNKYGKDFWFKCLDDNAFSFWKHMADVIGVKLKIIGETSWGTPICETISELGSNDFEEVYKTSNKND